MSVYRLALSKDPELRILVERGSFSPSASACWLGRRGGSVVRASAVLEAACTRRREAQE